MADKELLAAAFVQGEAKQVLCLLELGHSRLLVLSGHTGELLEVGQTVHGKDVLLVKLETVALLNGLLRGSSVAHLNESVSRQGKKKKTKKTHKRVNLTPQNQW